jgi:hypothetical protein
MLKFFKQLFGSKPAEPTPVPYKVETPAAKVSEFPFPSVQPAIKPAKSEKKPAVKNPAVKNPAVKKPAVKKPAVKKSKE